MTTKGLDFDIRPAPGPGARLRRGRPERRTSRATTPRTRPRSSRRSPSTRGCGLGRRPPRGHHGHHRRRRALGRADRARHQAARHRRAGHRRGGRVRSRRVSTPRSSRWPTRSRTCTARSTRCSSRRRPRDPSCSTVRAPGGVADRVGRAGRRRLRGAAPRARRQGAAESSYADLPVLPAERRRGRASRCASRSRTSPGCSRRSRALFAQHDVSIEAVRQPPEAGRRRRRSSSSRRTRRPRRPSRRPSRPSALCDVVIAVLLRPADRGSVVAQHVARGDPRVHGVPAVRRGRPDRHPR